MAQKADTTQQGDLITLDVAGRLLMITPERVRQLSRMGYIAIPERGKTTIVGAVQGYIQFLKDEARKDTRSQADSRVRDARAKEIELMRWMSPPSGISYAMMVSSEPSGGHIDDDEDQDAGDRLGKGQLPGLRRWAGGTCGPYADFGIKLIMPMPGLYRCRSVSRCFWRGPLCRGRHNPRG